MNTDSCSLKEHKNRYHEAALTTSFTCDEGSPRVEGDEDEEGVDDIEHEFKIEEEQNKKQQQQLNKHITEAMLYGKMSYGRGPDDEESNTPQFPPIITSSRSRPKDDGGWKERMDEWKSKQGILGGDPDDADPDMALYVLYRQLQFVDDPTTW
ncbi:hypothetical protein BHM03_00011006 [Ensete ventricosum]|nr:hypothetical protein BHM03_00011006 [Ensete ventricosum]